MTTAPNLIREQLLALADEMHHMVATNAAVNKWEEQLRSLAAEPVVSDTAASGREAVAWLLTHKGDWSKPPMDVSLQPPGTNGEWFDSNWDAQPLFLHHPADDVVAWRYQLHSRDWIYTDGAFDPRRVHDNGMPYQRLIVHPDDIRTVTQEGL